MGSTPQGTDPEKTGYSLANVAELLFGCLEATPARSVVEIGAYKGDLTRVLLEWAAGRETRIVAVDPTPPAELLALADEHPELELVREPSHEALRHIELPDALIIDGDHNYYTLSEELRLIDERAPGAEMPLLLFHDVAWPHARRDTYYAPERIPEQHRQPLAHNTAIVPGDPGVTDFGLHYEWAAEREGGPRNGVLTAIEDFVEGREGLRVATVPAFFGFGALWHRDAPWAARVAEIVEPWDRNPLVERLEANRVSHLVERTRKAQELGLVTQALEEERQRHAQQEQLLRAMLDSRAFGWAERLSRLNQRGRPIFSREQVKRALGEDGR